MQISLTEAQHASVVAAAARDNLDASTWARRVLLREAGQAPAGGSDDCRQ